MKEAVKRRLVYNNLLLCNKFEFFECIVFIDQIQQTET